MGFVPSNLTEDLLGTLSSTKLENKILFFNRKKDTAEWFYHNSIEVLDWPLYLPDLNPIEHLWNEIDRRIRWLSIGISDPDEL